MRAAGIIATGTVFIAVGILIGVLFAQHYGSAPSPTLAPAFPTAAVAVGTPTVAANIDATVNALVDAKVNTAVAARAVSTPVPVPTSPPQPTNSPTPQPTPTPVAISMVGKVSDHSPGTPIQPGQTVTSNLDGRSRMEDYYSVTLNAGQTLRATVATPSQKNYLRFTIIYPNGNTNSGNGNGSREVFDYTFLAAVGGTYSLEVHTSDDLDPPTTYTLHIEVTSR